MCVPNAQCYSAYGSFRCPGEAGVGTKPVLSNSTCLNGTLHSILAESKPRLLGRWLFLKKCMGFKVFHPHEVIFSDLPMLQNIHHLYLYFEHTVCLVDILPNGAYFNEIFGL